MPGIFGFTHSSVDENTHHLLNQMASALHDEQTYQSFQHTEDEISLGRVGLQIVQTGPQPAWNENHSVAVVMEGEVFDYRTHRDRLENKGHQFTTDSQAELIAHLYEDDGENFVTQLNGVFVAAIWDQRSHQLTIINDHLGLQPLYFTPNLTEGFAFASGVRALLAIPSLSRQLDHLAIAQFLTFDHVFDDHTLLKEVKALPGASILTFSDGNWRIERYWRPQYPEYYPVRNQLDYSEELLSILQRVATRQMPGDKPGGILMSGGLDSRVVAALLRQQSNGEAIQTFTMGQPDCDDERFAREVSTQLGMPHHFYRLKGNYLPSHVNQGVRITDGLVNAFHMHTLPNLSDQAQKAEIIYKGFLGDALIGYGITDRLWSSYDDATLPLAHYAVYQDQGLLLFDSDKLDHLMLPGTGEETYSSQVMETLAQAVRASQTTLPADQRNYIDLCQRVPRMTLNGVELVRSQAHVRLPFADKELVEFMLTVPPGYRYKRKIMKDLFIQQFPELAKIPYTETNYPMIHCRREVVLRAEEQIRWYLRALGLNWVSMPRKRPFAYYNDWFRNELRSWVESILLDHRTRDRGLFNPDFIKVLVEEHMAGQNHYSRLGVLISIELWQRQFIDVER